jgi:SAM-dependent methyltransferase
VQSNRVPEDLFRTPIRLEEGVYRALVKHPRVPLAQSSNFWPLTAALYEPLWRRRSLSLLTRGSFSTARELELMLAWLKPQPGERILDAAASAGLYARTLLRHTPSPKVHALDFSLGFLKKAQLYAEQDGVEPVFVHADVRALPYRDTVFDALVCGGSLNEFTDLPGTLAEFARVLKPGGRMWLMYLTRAEGWPGRTVQGLVRLSGLRFVAPARLEREAQRTGFGLERAQYRGPVAMALFRHTPP